MIKHDLSLRDEEYKANRLAQRNKEIAVAVLQGRTYLDVANEYGLSLQRARQITYKMCRKADMDLCRSITQKVGTERNNVIAALRGCAEKFITRINNMNI
jgi:hypothetical protein